MSGGGKTKTKSNEQSTSTTTLPAWMTSAGQDLYNKAAATAPVGAYQGQMTAGPAANQTAASAAAASGQGAWKPALGQAQTMTQAAASAPAASVTAAGFTPAAAAAGMNPYIQQVQQNTLDTMRRQDAADHATLNDGVQGAHAYGGTRQAVLEATQARDQAQTRQNYIDTSNREGYDAARTQFNTDADRSLQGQTTNASLYEQMMGRQLQGGQQLGQIAEATSNLGSRDIANLSSTGAADQATEDDALAAKYNEYLRAGNAPLENYKDIMAILAGAPRNVTTSGTSSGTSTTKQSGSLLNTLMGAAQIGASAFSDRRLKRNIARFDELDNGLGVYRYRYVWEGAHQPEHIGVMADEVARIMPEALGPMIAGYHTVDYSKLGGLLPC